MDAQGNEVFDPMTQLLTVKEVAFRLSCCQSNVYRLVREGRLKAIKIRGTLLFRKSDFEADLKRHEVKVSPAVRETLGGDR